MVKELYQVFDLLAPNETFADAGANVGAFSSIALKWGAQVEAFEPNPSVLSQLVKNTTGAVIHRFGLGARSHRAGIKENPDNIGNTTLITGDEVEVKRLDEVLSSVDLLKIDVEGMEPEVLEGMGALSPHTLYVEVNEAMLRVHGHTVRDIAKHLKGYRLYTFFCGAWYRVPSLWLMVSVLNPGRFLRRSSYPINVCATKKKFNSEPFWGLCVYKLGLLFR